MEIPNLSDILGLGPKSLVGVDVGQSSIKVAELERISKGRYRLGHFASIPLNEGLILEDEILKPDEVTQALKQALKVAKIKNNQTCIGLSGQYTIIKRLQLPPGPKEDLEDQVMWESEQYIPFNVDDSTVSYHVIGENSGGGMDVVIACARNDVIASHTQLAEAAGLKVKVVDLDILGLVNLFEYSYPEHAARPDLGKMLIDFGAQSTKVIVYKNKSIAFSRELPIGGAVITEEIQRKMGLNYIEAEDLKISGSSTIPEEILRISDNFLEKYLDEMAKTMNFYATTAADSTIDSCFITGGASLTPGLVEGLSMTLKCGVEFVNPFGRIEYNEKVFDRNIIDSIARTGGVALGLAMRRLEKGR